MKRSRSILVSAIALVLFISVYSNVNAGTLSCSVTTSCAGTVVFRMQNTSNSHAELSGQSNYTQLVCCSGVAGLSTACSGTYATTTKLSSTSNAHVEIGTQTNYANPACLSVPSGGAVSVGYQASNCTGFDTTLASMSEPTTNAHVGTSTVYTNKICASATGGAQSLTFSISDNSIGFGGLLSGSARYASGDTLGLSSDSASAHTISVSTSAGNGYSVTINGSTLTQTVNPSLTITPIGASAVASAVGTKQFGVRATVNSGTGSVISPYNTANWALNTSAFPSSIFSGLGDSVTTVFDIRYIANISASTDSGNYSSVLTYSVTANY